MRTIQSDYSLPSVGFTGTAAAQRPHQASASRNAASDCSRALTGVGEKGFIEVTVRVYGIRGGIRILSNSAPSSLTAIRGRIPITPESRLHQKKEEKK